MELRLVQTIFRQINYSDNIFTLFSYFFWSNAHQIDTQSLRLIQKQVQSTVGKKMAAVHFTTIPCEPNTAYKTRGKPNFYNICPCINKDIVYRRFENFITLLYLFMNVVKVFVR